MRNRTTGQWGASAVRQAAGRGARKRVRGFSLLELSLVLALMAGAAIILIPAPENDPAFVEEAAVLDTAERQLIYFIASQSRLPCPDQDGDGLEDCGGSGKGSLPFRSLGMNSAGYGLSDLPLRYSVYRRGDNTLVTGDAGGGNAYGRDADLAVRRDRFEPVMANDEWLSYDNAAASDFCMALATAEGQPFSGSHTHVRAVDGNWNVAYVLASPGRYDGDGVNGLFDGFNGGAGPGFNSDNTAISGSYDDRVRSRTFPDLAQTLQCQELIRSLNLIANGRQTEIEASDTLADNQVSTVTGSIVNGLGLALNAVDVVQAGFAVYDAALHLTAAISSLAGYIASCFVLVGCALIPGAAAGVASATVAVAAAAAAVVATAVSTAGQLVTTGLYIAAAVQAGITDLEFDTPDLSEAISQLETQILDERAAKQNLQARLLTSKQQESLWESLATGSLDSLKSYAAANDDPEFNGTPPVVSLIEQAIGEEEELAAAQQYYNEKEGDWLAAQQECAEIGDPSHPSCEQQLQAQQERDAALMALLQQTGTRNDAVALAVAGGEDFPVYQGPDADGNKQFTPCSAVADCTLYTQISHTVEEDGEEVERGIMANHARYYRQRNEVTFLEEQVAQKDENIAEMENALASMNCVQSGKEYNPDTGVCGPAGSAGGNSTTISAGGDAILRTVDGRHLVN